MDEVKPLTANWSRSILVDAPIDDEMVRRLTPKILALRQESDAPITVGLDSPGGSLASLDILMGLLTGPTQDKKPGRIITVVTHRAYSAAANFLAFGEYAVAMTHAQILYHDVRFGGLDDVTPEKARDAAKSLQDANDAFSLRLAHRIIKRLIWIYIDQRLDFERIQKAFPAIYRKYSELVASYVPRVDGFESVDLASFATCIWAKLSRQNDTLIKNVMDRLHRWINLTKLATSAPTYRPKGSKIAGMLDGPRHLHKLFAGKPEHFESSEDGLKLLLSLLVADISATKSERVDFPMVLERASREFVILNSMNDPKHIRHASDLMSRHGHIFFQDDVAKLPEDQRAAALAKAAPYATLLWHFCVLLCRELFEGEHILKPADAQLLGLVDEVAGGGPVQSRREFWISRAKPSDPAAPST